MDDIHTYQIEIDGQTGEADLNATGPMRLEIIPRATTTCLTLRADQSALIGLLRHLHGLGFVLLSVQCL